MLAPWKKNYDQPRQHIKKQRHYFANKSLSSQGYGFFSSHVYLWELDHKESWALKNWCFWTVVLGKTLESPLDWEEILKEINPEYSLEGLMLKLKLQHFVTWCKELTHLKRPWCWERLKVGGERDNKGWDGWIASLMRWTWVWVGYGSFGDGQGSLTCCSPWGCKESDRTERLNWLTWILCCMGSSVKSLLGSSAICESSPTLIKMPSWCLDGSQRAFIVFHHLTSTTNPWGRKQIRLETHSWKWN